MRRERVADRVCLDERARRVVIHSRSQHPQEMSFDYVFASRTSQHKLYTGCQLQRTVKAVARGEEQRACVIAYGQSGSGKTYSLYGDEESPALVQHAARDIFKVVDYSRNPEQVEVRVSFLEVSSDRLHDLLDTSKMDLHIRHTKLGAQVEGLSEHVVKCTDDVMRLIRGGLSRTSYHAIRNSFENNCTHTVLSVKLIYQSRSGGEVWEGHVQFVDLAGADKTDSEPQQPRVEARKSSLALFSLAQVVIALVQKGAQENAFIPYRNSVLTRLLKGSLDGNCRTLILVCISPLFANLHTTLNSLKFAAAAKSKDNSLWRVQIGHGGFARQVPPFKGSYSDSSKWEDHEGRISALPGQTEDEVTANKAVHQPVTEIVSSCHLPDNATSYSSGERLRDGSAVTYAMEPILFAEAAESVGLDAGNYILYLAEKGMGPEQFAEAARNSGMSLVELAQYSASAGIHPMDFARHYGVLGHKLLKEGSQKGTVWLPYLWSGSMQDLLDYGSALERGVRCQNRRVGDQVYEGVFSGSDGAAFFMEALEGVSTVAAAEKVGEKLRLLGVIAPVGDQSHFLASPRHWYRFTYEDTVCDGVLHPTDTLVEDVRVPRHTARTPVCAIL